MARFKEFDLDKNLNPVPGGTELHVQEVAIDSTTWTALTVPAGISDCKGFFIKTRNESNFKLSHDSEGSAYMTMDGAAGLGLSLGKLTGNTLCYIQGTTSTTLECLMWS